MEIPVFQHEIQDGLSDLVKKSFTVSYLTKMNLLEKPSDVLIDRARAFLKTQAGVEDQIDLQYFSSILVSTGWNLNDDVFDPYEMWDARKSPTDKQVNYQHDQSQIIGHIISTTAVDEDLNVIESVESPPDKYHLLTEAVIYKFWEDSDKQEEITNLIEGIRAGKWYVSMEALHKGFDYAIKDGDETYVIARSHKTSYLTKYLRFYGGEGEYEGKKIGRLLRNIVFSGKGIVAEPANPDSKILKTEAFITKSQEKLPIEKILGYRYTKQYTKGSKMNELEILKEQNQKLEETNKTLAEKVASLEASIKKNDIDALNVKIASLESQVKTQTELATANEAKLVEVNKLLDESKKSYEKLTVDYKSATAELTKFQADEKNRTRAALIVKEKGYTEEEATSIVANLVSVDDAQFNAIVASFPKKEVKVETTSEKTQTESTVNLASLQKVEATTTNTGLNVNTESQDEFAGLRAEIATYFNKNTQESDGE